MEAHAINRLNPPQQDAVFSLGAPVLVIAGAGSGKTNVIAHKIKHIIDSQYCSAEQIAAITFTNKAAQEMRQRLKKILPTERHWTKMILATFHTLGLHILRQEAPLIGLKKKFSILDAHDSNMALQDITKLSARQAIRDIKNYISQWKNNNMTPAAALEKSTSDKEQQYALIYARYQSMLRSYQALDFDDLIVVPLQLFEDHPDRLAFWQNKLRYFLVDEYQDTNIAQCRLLKKLSYPVGNITFVGDDDQAIYAWRGATIENMRSLQDDYPHLKIIRLEQNYRSTNTILDAANKLIQKNEKLFEKKLWSQLGKGKTISLSKYKNEELEAYEVTQKMIQTRLQKGHPWSHYAILYRSNHQARILEHYLRQNNVPYNLSGGQSFFELTEIKDILSYLRLMVNHDDDIAFIRAATKPNKGIGPTTLGKLGEYASTRQISLFEAVYETGLTHQLNEKNREPLHTFCEFIGRMAYRSESEPADEIIQEILSSIAYEEYLMRQFNDKEVVKKWSNIQHFVSFIKRSQEKNGNTLPTITQNIALMNIIAQKNTDKEDMLELSTIHAAKGLEFHCVFIIGCNEGILPHQESIDLNTIEEERRLMYVGITRAKEELNISFTEHRRSGGELVPGEPSRFISEADILASSSQTASSEERNNYLERIRSAGVKKKPIVT